MRALMVMAGMCITLGVLAAVAIGAMIAATNGRPNPVLLAIFAIDSVAILLIAIHLHRHWRRREP